MCLWNLPFESFRGSFVPAPVESCLLVQCGQPLGSSFCLKHVDTEAPWSPVFPGPLPGQQFPSSGQSRIYTTGIGSNDTSVSLGPTLHMPEKGFMWFDPAKYLNQKLELVLSWLECFRDRHAKWGKEIFCHNWIYITYIMVSNIYLMGQERISHYFPYCRPNLESYA